MNIKGSKVENVNDKILGNIQWFIAHEAAHFWLGQSLNYKKQGDTWFTEGGANFAAVSVVSAAGSNFNVDKERLKYVDACRKDAMKGSIVSAQERQDFDIYYNCGALFHMTANKLAQNKNMDWFAFIKKLIAAQSKTDSALSTKEWLAELRNIGASKTIISDMQNIYDGKEGREASVNRLAKYVGLSENKI